MLFPILLLAHYLFWGAHNPEKTVQPTKGVQLSGVCWDLATAVYLPVEAFAITSDNNKIRLGQSNKDGLFNVSLPLSAKYISFTSQSYRTVTLPVTFVNRPSANAKFVLGIIMGKNDTSAVQQTHHLLLSYNMPDSLDVKYDIGPTGSNAKLPMVVTAHGNRVSDGGQFTVKKGTRRYISGFEGTHPGPYRIWASTTDGHILTDRELTVKEGITFMEVRANESNEPVPSGMSKAKSEAINTVLTLKTVYFEQSRYELTNATRSTLDSIAQLLFNKQDLVAQITGYTDNVGERKLNVTLSEYRARTVANYLRRKGVQEDQMTVTWQGPDSPVSSNGLEADKVKNRRVTVQLAPK